MINAIQKQLLLQKVPPSQVKETPTGAAQNMMSSFEKMISEVNRDQVGAETKVSQVIAGKNQNITGAIIAMEKADVSMRMLMTVRNKMISAYEEVMRMQV